MRPLLAAIAAAVALGCGASRRAAQPDAAAASAAAADLVACELRSAALQVELARERRRGALERGALGARDEQLRRCQWEKRAAEGDRDSCHDVLNNLK